MSHEGQGARFFTDNTVSCPLLLSPTIFLLLGIMLESYRSIERDFFEDVIASPS